MEGIDIAKAFITIFAFAAFFVIDLLDNITKLFDENDQSSDGEAARRSKPCDKKCCQRQKVGCFEGCLKICMSVMAWYFHCCDTFRKSLKNYSNWMCHTVNHGVARPGENFLKRVFESFKHSIAFFILHLCLNIIVIGICIWISTKDKKFIYETKVGVSGTTVNVEGSANASVLSSNAVKLWDATDIAVPLEETDQFFITTKLVTILQKKTPSEQGWEPEEKSKEAKNISKVEEIKQINDLKVAATIRNHVYIKFPNRNDGTGYNNYHNIDIHNCLHGGSNKKCPVFTMEYLLNEVAEQDPEAVEDLIAYGGVASIRLKWDCYIDDQDKYCWPEYYFKRLDNSDGHTGGYNYTYTIYPYNNETSRAFVRATGIVFLIETDVTGYIFSVGKMFEAIATGFALLKSTKPAAQFLLTLIHFITFVVFCCKSCRCCNDWKCAKCCDDCEYCQKGKSCRLHKVSEPSTQLESIGGVKSCTSERSCNNQEATTTFIAESTPNKSTTENHSEDNGSCGALGDERNLDEASDKTPLHAAEA